MSVTKIYIDAEGSTKALAIENYITQLATELSTYGFTTTYVDNNTFYITANITGLNTMYYSFYTSSTGENYIGYYCYPRKSAPTVSDHGSQYSTTHAAFFQAIAVRSYIDDQSQIIYHASGCAYVVQNSNGDVLLALTHLDYGSSRLMTTFIGKITVTTAQNGNTQAYFFGYDSNECYILFPKGDKEGLFSLNFSSSSPTIINISANSILIRNAGFYNASNLNYTGGNAGYINSLYTVYYTTLSLVAEHIYIIDGNQYLSTGYYLIKL